MARVEDGFLMGMTEKVFHKRHGIIKDAVCLHATGPAYAREFGLQKVAQEKFNAVGMGKMAEAFE